MNESARFWAQVDVRESDECWEWDGARDVRGYGRFSAGGRIGGMQLSHRYAWRLLIGSIPAGMVLMHHCDNPPCVNPDHLSVATHAENMRDMAVKHRSPSLKLSDDEVREIRSLNAQGVSQRKLAKRFGTSQSNVSLIVRGKSRRHVDDLIALIQGERP